jgi:hypothetical protein
MAIKRKDRIRNQAAQRKGSGNPLDEEFWPLVDELYEMGLELRRPFEERWIINLSFISNQQYAFYNQTAGMLQHLLKAKGRVRIVDNKILPRFRKQVSRLIRNNPRMSVVPNSTEQKDLKAAKVADKVLKSWWRNRQLKKKIRELAGWIYSCGNGYLDDRWDPKLGPVKFDGETGKLIYLGDAECSVWSPFEVLVPSGGLGDTDLHAMPWLIKLKYRPLEWFVGNYARGGEVVEETRPRPYIDTGSLFGVTGTGGVHKIEGATEIQLYMQPTPEYPKGLYVVGANGVILGKQDYPFNYYHMEQFKDLEVPGVFYGLSTTEVAIWLQKVWNRTISDIAEYNRVMARGKWLIPRSSNMEVAPDDTHGQRLFYTPVLGHKPEMLDVKGLPETYQQILNVISNSFMELYFQHEVTQGTNRSDIRSGDMVSLLLEQDDAGNVPTHAVFEESLEAVMRRVLGRIQKGYETERTLSVIGGPGQEIEVFAFKGADLQDNTDVYVTKESSLPDSRAMRQERIKNNFKETLYGDPNDPKVKERVLRMLEEVPDEIEDIFKEGHLDRENARMENVAILQNPTVVYLVNTYDDHQVHLEEHHFARKQPEYQMLKFQNPKNFAILEMGFASHEQMHQKFLEELAAAMERQMLRQGGGGER